MEKGTHHSKESREKLSRALKGRKYAKRRPATDEYRRKQAEARKGKVASPEARRRMSEARKGIPCPHMLGDNNPMRRNPWNKSVPLSEERKRRLSVAQKGRKIGPMAEEHKRKISAANLGRICSEETKKRIRDAHKGIPHPQQTGAKHGMWRGGLSFLPYPPEFNSPLKKAIRERDGYTCQRCGSPNSRHVHHINYDKSDCRRENLISLCLPCNSRVNSQRAYWTGFFQGLLLGISTQGAKG